MCREDHSHLVQQLGRQRGRHVIVVSLVFIKGYQGALLDIF